MAKKDKKDKKLKKSAESAPAEAVELDEITPGDVVAEVADEVTGEVIAVTASKGGSGKGTVAFTSAEAAAYEAEDESEGMIVVEAELGAGQATRPRARPTREAKKIEIAPSTLKFVAEFPLEDIVPRERNTRFRGKETERVLSQMIQRFGWTQPLTLDAEHRIVDGQYRYELAKKWKLATVPVVISDGVSAEAGTTDLFHMLSGRIAEWDKWNYPATDAVLKSLDGGLTTEKILGFETTSEAGPLRDLAREIGWFIEVIPKTLSGTTVTLETLATLLKKQLAGKYHYDPAQLLYIEALREQLEGVRREMVESGETAGGVKPKLEQHIGEEARKLAAGEAIAEANGYELDIDEENGTAVFTADAEIAYVVNKVTEAEEAARVQINSARDMESRFREMADGKKVGLTQFKILASYFSDMTPEEAGDFFNGKAAEEFNAFVDTILEENRTISPNRSANFPMTEAELRTEQYRLRAEDIRKDTENQKKGEPKGLSSLLVDQLKALLKEEGLPLAGKKAELVARLEEAGYGADGTKAGAAVSEAEEAEDSALEVAEGESVEDDVPMVLAADEPVILVTEEIFVEAPLDEAPTELDGDIDSAVAKILKVAREVSTETDLKALKKRGKELRAKAEEGELSKAELKEFKAIKKELKAAKG